MIVPFSTLKVLFFSSVLLLDWILLLLNLTVMGSYLHIDLHYPNSLMALPLTFAYGFWREFVFGSVLIF